MATLKLNLASDMGINTDKNAIAFKKSSKEGNTLTFKEDGLYAEAEKGADGSGGTGYTHTGDYAGVRIGYESPYGMTTSDRRVLLTNVAHRVYTASNDDIYTLNGFRPEIDYVLPGDMVIFKNEIYLITSVTTTGANGSYGGPGNKIAGLVGPLKEGE